MAVLICFVGASIIYKTHSPIILLLISVYSVDAILTVIYRKSIGEKLTEPHRKHIYQKMVHTAKMPHLTVSIIYALLQMVINVIVLYTYKLDLTIQFATLVVVILFLIFLYVLMFKRLEVKE